MKPAIGVLAALLLMNGALAARADVRPGAAPADEYFGRHHESILEIRNRLDRLESRDDVSRAMMREMNDLSDCILDWQRRYPNDPWMPHVLARLLRQYHRANADNEPHAAAALNILRGDYPNSPETHRIVALIDGTGNLPAENGWHRFDAMRDGDGGGQP